MKIKCFIRKPILNELGKANHVVLTLQHSTTLRKPTYATCKEVTTIIVCLKVVTYAIEKPLV